MPKTLLALLCCLLLLSNLSAATTVNGVQWDTRTTGSDLNSGGFDTGAVSTCSGGTDYSQADSPHVTFNGSTVTATTAGVSTTLTLTGYTVQTTDKCNTLQVASGTNFIANVYVITNVNTGTNSWSLDQTPTSGVGAAMVGRMGGGFATIGKAAGVWSAQDTIWIKTGTNTLTSTVTPLAAATGGPIQSTISGYGSVHGDTGRATITSATNSVALFTISNAFRYAQISNLTFTHTAGTRGDCIDITTGGGQAISILHSSFSGCQIAINATNDGTGLLVSDVEIGSSISHAVSSLWSTRVENSNFHNNGGTGLITTAQVASGVYIEAVNDVFYANTHCIQTSGSNLSRLFIVSNDCVGSTSTGILFGSNLGGAGTWGAVVRDNIIYGNGAWGIDGNTGTPNPSANDHNAYGANVSGAFTVWLAGTGDVTLSADPFVARTGGNFALNSTVGGGAALKGVGFPGTIPNAGAGVMDIGALQSGTGAATASANSSYVQ